MQAIRIGTRTYGYLAVGVTGTPSPIDQLLIGHANSLLGLEFERPNRVRREQGQVHAAALALALAGGTGTASAIGLLRTATDDRGRIRMLTVLDARDGRHCVRWSTTSSPPMRATRFSTPTARRCRYCCAEPTTSRSPVRCSNPWERPSAGTCASG